MLRGKRRIEVRLCTRGSTRVGLWGIRGRPEGWGLLGSRRGGKFIDLRVPQRAVSGWVATLRIGEARRVFYICSPSV